MSATMKSVDAIIIKDNDEEQDDDWDDWGDAEDNIIQPPSQTTTAKQNTNSHKEEISDNENQQQQQKQKQQTPQEEQLPARSSWWGGISSVLSTASEGIGNITSSVSQGLNQVIGVPPPEELARINCEEAEAAARNKTSENDDDDESSTVFGKNLVSGVTHLGSKVLNTGLDTLEGIGKKTMHILQENDPLLKNKRKLLGLEPERPNLSDVLKSAKQDAEEIENTLRELKIAHNEQQMHFEPLFEQKCGLMHLEALDILAQESALKLKSLRDSLSGKALKDLQETIEEVQELMEPEDADVDNDGEYTAEGLQEKLLSTIEDLGIPIKFDEFSSNWQETLDWLEDATTEPLSVQNIYEQGIVRLAEFCALAMCKLHKIAELLLVQQHHSTASEVDSIVQLCHEFKVHLHGVTHRVASKLTGLSHGDEADKAKNMLNILCGESVVAMAKVDCAFKLFVPIIQIGAA